MVAKTKPIGEITRGTTNPNRLRRVDRYLAQLEVIRRSSAPLVVDLGYGRSPITTLEMLHRLAKANRQTRVIGIEIDPERVQEAKPLENESLRFIHGGFEIPLPEQFSDRSDVDLIRAFNVLRQYSEAEVMPAWQLMLSRLSPDGVLIEGTCDEIGRVASWITVDRSGPKSFTISLRLEDLDFPSKVAERLPKILIHKNTPGNKIHDYLSDLDAAWQRAVSLGSFGVTQRFQHTAKELIARGWPIQNSPKRFRLGEITLDYQALLPY